MQHTPIGGSGWLRVAAHLGVSGSSPFVGSRWHTILGVAGGSPFGGSGCPAPAGGSSFGGSGGSPFGGCIQFVVYGSRK